MLFWAIRTTIISITLIFLVHHLILFFTKTLTIPKIKDLVNAPAHKYENIYNAMSSTSSSSNPYALSKDYENLLPSSIKPEVNSMKNELKNFLKKQLKGNSGNSSSSGSGSSSGNGASSTDISALETYSANQYAAY